MADDKNTKTEEAPAAEEKTEPKSQKAPLPDGYVTPVNYAKTLGEKGEDGKPVGIRPQIVYGYIKNNGPESKNPFPAEQNTDGAWMVNVKKADAWMKALVERKAARDAKKAAEAKAAEAKATEAPAS